MIDVCEIETGKVVQIDETKYDETKYSKDTANCKPPTMNVCELQTGTVITINKSDFDAAKHSTDTENCEPEDNDSGSGGTSRPIPIPGVPRQ